MKLVSVLIAVAGCAGGATSAAPAATAPPPSRCPPSAPGKFDRCLLAEAMNSVDPQACRKPDGPTGTSHIRVTFKPDGTVDRAEIDDGPIRFTPEGDCVEAKYRAVKMAPWTDSGPVAASKTIEMR